MSAKQIFEKFDKNKNGKLSLEEFREAVHAFSLKICEEEVTQRFKEIDVDADGELSSVEFTSSVDKMLKEAFDLCDVDGDGKITSSEFHADMTELRNICAEIVKAADADNDHLRIEKFMVMRIGEF